MPDSPTFTSTLTVEQIAQSGTDRMPLWRAYWADPSRHNLDRLIEANIGLSIAAAERTARRVGPLLEIEDAVGNALYGLCRLVPKVIERPDQPPHLTLYRKVAGYVFDCFRDGQIVSQEAYRAGVRLHMRPLLTNWKHVEDSRALARSHDGFDRVDDRDEVEWCLGVCKPDEARAYRLRHQHDIEGRALCERFGGCSQAHLTHLWRRGRVAVVMKPMRDRRWRDRLKRMGITQQSYNNRRVAP